MSENPFWAPQAKSLQILEAAWKHIQSVPYRVSLRWVFYRLLQDGVLQDKGKGYRNLKDLLIAARKNFYKDWRPDTLADETREIIIRGDGSPDGPAWVEKLAQYGVKCSLDRWANHPFYPIIAFEARAMTNQFLHYTEDITLVPFGGDPSLNLKWEVPQLISTMDEKYWEPVKLFYFGDCDKKGNQIDASAIEDVRRWCDVPFEFERVGLSLNQTGGVPENPDRPGEYQWEALTDSQAASVIEIALGQLDLDSLRAIKLRERSLEAAVKDHLQTFKWNPT
jgi:hypothetical protein